MLFTCFLNVFPKARYVYLSYLSMVTALLTFTTKKMYTNSFDLGVYNLDVNSRAFDAAGVGSMFLCMVNFGLIIFIGVSAVDSVGWYWSDVKWGESSTLPFSLCSVGSVLLAAGFCRAQ